MLFSPVNLLIFYKAFTSIYAVEMSVRPSLGHAPVLCQNGLIYHRNYFIPDSAIVLVFSALN